MKPLVAGNWKMNGLSESLEQIVLLESRLAAATPPVDVMICPPATLIRLASDKTSLVKIGAQDCHGKKSGAHTGDLSAEMVCEAGAVAILVGHSERRADHGETSAMVAEKASAALFCGATAIICVGETQTQREKGETKAVVLDQLTHSIPPDAKTDQIVIAYEPVWAIGTGLTPTPEDVAEVHGAIRDHLVSRFGVDGEGIRILYGGSVKPSNAAELMAVTNVNGALVGGASLKADDFFGIIQSYLPS